jgi:hypothetical protein
MVGGLTALIAVTILQIAVRERMYLSWQEETPVKTGRGFLIVGHPHAAAGDTGPPIA